MPFKLVPPRKGKSPNWSIRGTYLGHYIDRSVGSPERRVAQQALRKLKEDVERGEFGKPTGPTFMSAALAYVDAGGEERFMAPLLKHLGHVALADIDQQTIDEAALTLYPNGTPATRNRHVYTVVSAVLKSAGIERALKRPKGSGGAKRTDWLWPEQAFKLFKEADKIDPELGVFLRLLTYTGLRLSEALGLRRTDVKLDENFAFVAETKSGDPRPVFLPPVLVAALAARDRATGNAGHSDSSRVFRFTKSGRLYHLLRSATAAADLPSLTFHGLRHTWATWMRRYAGLDTKGLVATGAWRDRQAASRYEHAIPSEEAMKAALLPTEDE